MKERPILFCAPMVRAILDGRKTQTRRIMKVQPPPDARVTVEHYTSIVTDRRYGDMKPGKEVFGALWDGGECGLPCPYGQPGDRLWVRETWQRAATDTGECLFYRADADESGPWRPSIHMPRWASRITLRITDICVERLLDISENDARAEGVSSEWDDYEKYGQSEPYRYGFSELWNSINGADAWDKNPWVWAISFERVQP